MSTDELTDTVEDYLKTIYKLQEEQESASTSELAEHLDVAPSSVSGMTKKLSEMNLVEHTPYKGVKLTEYGLKIALEVVRHHRLIERFLAEALDVSWDRVHEEAERLEHVLSEELEDRMAEFLDHPETDPHGSPIPSREGEVDQQPSKPLTEMEPGETSMILEVSDHDSNLLRFLGEKGIYPGTRIKHKSTDPYEGGVTVSVQDTEHTLGMKAAQHIRVRDENE